MPNNNWVGAAPSIAQALSFTLSGTFVNGETIVITYGTKTQTYTVNTTDGVTPAAIATAIATLFYPLIDSGGYPEFAEQEASTNGVGTFTLTANLTGQAFAVTVSTNSTLGFVNGGSSSTGTVTTANSGPNDVSVPSNWSRGVLPQSALANPVISAAVAVSGGTLVDTTTYYAVITATNANGETIKSNEISYTAASPNLSFSTTWPLIHGATSIKVFLSTTSGVYTNCLYTTLTGTTTSATITSPTVTTGTPPVSNTAVGDDVQVKNTGAAMLYNLDVLTGYQWNSYTRESTMTGQIGLPLYNSASGYLEYRATYLPLGVVANGTIALGSGAGAHPNIERYDLAATGSGTKFNILGTQTGQQGQAGQPALYLKNGTWHLQSITKGNVWVCNETGADTCTLQGDVNVNFVQNQATDVTLTLGAGVTWDTIQQAGGSVTALSGGNEWQVEGGTATFGEVGVTSANITTVNLQCGTYFYFNAAGTLTTVMVGEGSTLDASLDTRTKHITNFTLYGSYNDSNLCVVLDNALSIPGGIGGPCGASVNWGKNFSLTSPVAGSGSSVFGAVSSVGLSLPNIFSVSNSPVTDSGTLTAVLVNQNANTVFAGPASGSPAIPTFRGLVTADLVAAGLGGTVTSVDLTMPGNFTVTNNPVTSSGTLTVHWNVTAGSALIGNGTGSLTEVAPGTAGHVFRSTGTAWASSAIQPGDLPVGSASQFGAVKVDNVTITATAGVISAVTATNSVLGVVKPDNVTISISGGVISVVDLGGILKATYTTTSALPANTYNNGTLGVGATLTGNANGALPSQDGQVVGTGDVILVLNEVATANNGLYVVTNTGSAGAPYVLTRSAGLSTSGQFGGTVFSVELGTANGGSLWQCQTDHPTVGTTGITFIGLNRGNDLVEGNGIVITGNSVAVSGYTGETSIVTLGTVATGTWHGTIIGVAYGGSGLNCSAAANGTLLIGNGTGFTLSTLTAGTGVTIDNTVAGHITINCTNDGTVTSINVSGGTTGLTLTGGPITTTGIIVLSGTLVVANGGTGATSFTPYAVLCGGTSGTGALQDVGSLGTLGQVLTSQGPSALPSWTDGTVQVVWNEAPTGAINSSNVTYTLANAPLSAGGSLHKLALYKNGVRLIEGIGSDYTVSGNTITMSIAPLTGNSLAADYQY